MNYLLNYFYYIFGLVLFLGLLITAGARGRGEFWARLVASGAAVYLLGTGLQVFAFYRMVSDQHYFQALQNDLPLSYLLEVAPVLLFQCGHILFLIGMTSAPFWYREPSAGSLWRATDIPRPLNYHKRNGALMGLLILLTLGLYPLFWLYRSIQELKPLDKKNRLDFTPRQAVGLLFLPIFNVYWVVRVFFRLFQCVGDIKRRLPDLAAGTYSWGFAFLLLLGAMSASIVLQIALFGSNVHTSSEIRHLQGFALFYLFLLLTPYLYTQWAINSIWNAIESLAGLESTVVTRESVRAGEASTSPV